MKSIFVTLVVAAAAAVEAANVLSMNVARNPATQNKLMNPRNLGKRHLAKRAGTVTATLINNVTAGSYLASIKVGTPGQPIEVALDTGSSDLWVLSSDAEVCQESSEESFGGDQSEEEGCPFGTFDANNSKTFDDILPNQFLIQYQDSTGAEGDWFTDDVSIGNATLTKVQMGLGAGNTNVNVGIMGIGYDTNEAAEQDGVSKYPNVIDQLVSQGVINVKAYSLYLDDLFQSTGTILFGGIDKMKYTGSLISIPIQADDRSHNITSFTVALTNLAVKNGSKDTTIGSGLTTPVVLDSGTTLTYIPDSLAKKLYEELGAVDDSENTGEIFIDCNANKSDVTINYQFGGSKGPTISVAIAELLIQEIPSEAFASIGEDAPFDRTCLFGIFPGGEGPYLLGDSFLRSAYAVYDLENNEIGLAQSSFDSSSSDIVEFETNASGIPDVSGEATGVTVQQTATGKPGVGGESSTMKTTDATFSTKTETSPVSSTTPTHHTTSSSTPPTTSAASKISNSGSGSSGASTVPAFDFASLFVLSVSGLFSLMGGIWFVL